MNSFAFIFTDRQWVQFSPVRKTLAAFILIFLSAALCFSETDGPTAARVIIKIPDGIAPDAVWVRYLVDRRISRGERIRLEGNAREYVILRPRNTNGQPENVKIVLYRLGCEFKIYDLNLLGDSEVEERFQCDPPARSNAPSML